jgi:hypothetical protein
VAVLQDKLLIEWAAFTAYKDVSEHMDDKLMETFIRESQIADLEPFLGAELYLLLLTDFTAPSTWGTQKYEDLFNGSDYTTDGKTIRQHGLQPMLSLFAYARMLDNIQLSVSRIGPVTYVEEDSSQATTQSQIKTKVINTRAMAVRYQEEVAYFLRNNTADYTEWVDGAARNKPFEFTKL